MPDIAILTGDLIGSTRKRPEQVEAAWAALRQIMADVLGTVMDDPRLTRFRGDGWQVKLPPRFALRGLLMISAALKAAHTGLDTRVSLAIAPYDDLGNGDLNAASGPVFTLSGRNLDAMTRLSRNLVFAAPGDPAERWKNATLHLAWAQAARWSPPQAEVMAHALMLPPPRQEDMAARLRLTRQAVQARLASAGFAALGPALAAFEETP